LVGLRTLAAVVSLVNGAWGILSGIYWYRFYHPAAFPGPNTDTSLNLIVLSLGIILLLDSAVCFIGPSVAFYASAVLSAILLVYELSLSISFGSAETILAIVLALATIVLDVAAARVKKVVSEENHPLNLPVFG
jgi:hypothetical protein